MPDMIYNVVPQRIGFEQLVIEHIGQAANGPARTQDLAYLAEIANGGVIDDQLVVVQVEMREVGRRHKYGYNRSGQYYQMDEPGLAEQVF